MKQHMCSLSNNKEDIEKLSHLFITAISDLYHKEERVDVT